MSSEYFSYDNTDMEEGPGANLTKTIYVISISGEFKFCPNVPYAALQELTSGLTRLL